MNLSDAVVTVVGMGLMGGSLGKALVQRRACREVRALVRNPGSIKDILARAAADVAGSGPREILGPSDLVVFATPVRTIERQLEEYSSLFKPAVVITDMGSVKRNVVRAMGQLPPSVAAVGGHPMCGKEISGLTAASADLFSDKLWILTPTVRSTPAAVELVSELARSVGSRTTVMAADEHDLVAACVSHLTYLMASTLVAVAEETATTRPAVWDVAASGFRDTSRVAAGNVTMMMDILAANRDAVIEMLKKAGRELEDFVALLENPDETGLKRKLSAIKARRSAMFQPTTEKTSNPNEHQT